VKFVYVNYRHGSVQLVRTL